MSDISHVPAGSATGAGQPPGPAGWRSRLGPYLRVHAVLVAGFCVLWALLAGGAGIDAVREHWAVSLTMVFGSLVGGGTSEGGGAVAFPVMTKVLGVAAADARIFTFMIQSVGMVAASICILLRRIPVERRVLLLGTPAGVAGVLLSTTTVGGALSGPTVRVAFTCVLAGLAVALVVKLRGRHAVAHRRVPVFGPRERAVVLVAGFVGGVVSGAAGVGENIAMFVVLVLLFKVSESVATPTTVVMMSVVSVAAAASHLLILRDVPAHVIGFWLAASPVVVVFAPLGAFLCSLMSRTTIARILIALIVVEIASTVLLVRAEPALLVGAAFLLAAMCAMCVAMLRTRRYDDGPDGPLPDGPMPDGPMPDGPMPDGPVPDGAPEPLGEVWPASARARHTTGRRPGATRR